VNKLVGSLLVATMSTVVGDAYAQSRPGTADITIVARTPNAVHVEERYTLGPSAASIELRTLTLPCVVIENMRIERDGVELTGSEARNGPWIIWRDTTPPGGDSLQLFVRYNVWLGGSRTIPLAHLTAPLATQDSSRRGAVTVDVRFVRGAGEVEFPHMTRQAPNEWSARYVAAPSFVKVGGPAFACDRRPDVPGDNGGLVWRFFLLVGIMGAWVPLYLAWARRSGDSA
jgi:hypothetical protein